MELTFGERFGLLNILPQSGDYTTLKIVRTLREALSVSRDELVAAGGAIDEEGGANWPDDPGSAKILDLTPQHVAQIVSTLQKLNDQKQLELKYLSLCDKFLGEPEKPQ